MKTVTPATDTVISLADAKMFLRVDNNAEDKLITRMIANATDAIETIINKTLITTVKGLTLTVAERNDYWVRITDSPVQSATAVVSLNNTELQLDTTYDRDHVVISDVPAGATIEVQVTVGWPTAEDVPGHLVQAVLSLVAFWYTNRETSGVPTEIRNSVIADRTLVVL